MNKAGFRMLAVALLLLVAFIAKDLLLVPPSPPALATAGEFDSARALARLQRILGDERPHPVDTLANDAVRARLVTELRAIGLDPQVRTRENCRAMPGSRTTSCSRTHNVVAVIGADRPGKALLLNAHYDSTPAGPGAADDGIGVATLIEVADNLRSRQPPHPVILLFNEGEEFGLNGAAAFVEGDPLAHRIGALINIESRGVSGPAVMFETSQPNGAALSNYAAAAKRPYANSLMTDLAQLIPNSTDVVAFKKQGWRTLSFAITGNETRYHSPGDTIAALDRSSLYHMGSEVLGAARTLDPEPSAGTSRWTYADIAGRILLRLPLLFAGLLLGGLLIAAFILAWRGRSLGRPLGAAAAAVTAGIGAVVIASFAAGLFRAGDFWRAYPLVTYLALYAALVAAELGVLGWLGRQVGIERLRSAAWLLILLFGSALSLLVPGATIFFLIGPALALLGLALPPVRTLLLWAGAVVQLVMFAQLLASLEMLLVDGPLWAVAPLAALAALPLLVEIADRPVRRTVVALGALSLVLWVVALAIPQSSADRPLGFTLDYVRDDSSGKSVWAVSNKLAPLPQALDRIGHWERGTVPYSGRSRWVTKAPAIAIPTGSVTKIAETRSGKGRIVRLRLNRGGGDAMAIKFAKDVGIIAMGAAGRLQAIEADADPGPSLLRCSGRGCDGMLVDLRLSDTAPVEAKLITTRFALPQQGLPLAKLRPANAHTQYAANSSIRVIDVQF